MRMLARLKDAGPDDLKIALRGHQRRRAAAGDYPRALRRRNFDVPIYEGYGLTETIGPIAFNVPRGDQARLGRPADSRRGDSHRR